MSRTWQLLEAHINEGAEADLKKLINHVAQRYGEYEASQLSDYMQDNVGNDDPEVIQTLIRSVAKRYDPQALALAKKLLPPPSKPAPTSKPQVSRDPLYVDPETAKAKDAAIDNVRQMKQKPGTSPDPKSASPAAGIGTQLTLKPKDPDLEELPVSNDVVTLQKLQQYVKMYPKGRPYFKKDGTPDVERSAQELERVKKKIQSLGKGGISTIKQQTGMQPDSFFGRDEDEQPAFAKDTPESIKAAIATIDKTLSDNPDHPRADALKAQKGKLQGRLRRLGNVPQELSTLRAQIKAIEDELKSNPNHPDKDSLTSKLETLEAQLEKLKAKQPKTIEVGETPDPPFEGEKFGQFWAPNAYSAPEDDEVEAAEREVAANPGDEKAKAKLAILRRRAGGFEKKASMRQDAATGQEVRGKVDQNPAAPRSVVVGKGKSKRKWTDDHGKYWVTKELGAKFKYPSGWVPPSVYKMIIAKIRQIHAKKTGAGE